MFRLCRVLCFVSEFTDNHPAMIEQQVDHRFIDIKLLADAFAFFQKGFWRFLHVYASGLRTALVVVQFLSKQCSCCHTSHVASKSEPFIFTVDSSVFSCFLRGRE